MEEIHEFFFVLSSKFETKAKTCNKFSIKC